MATKLLESYLNPLLLTYVDRYILDFKRTHSTVSLFGGATFYDVILRADVINKELNLPFILTSGRINELHIQVPILKITSEPIVVTINTIECVLKYGFDNERTQDESEEESVPPVEGYLQSAVRRIVSNISFKIHHLILKFEEDGIVLSMNIKSLSLDNANEDWVPAFTDVNVNEMKVRKLIRLSDVTLCLDKRNEAGKINIYEDPILYKCELEFRIVIKFISMMYKRPLYTHITCLSERLDFSLSSTQLPMVYRLMEFLNSLRDEAVSEKRLSIIRTSMHSEVLSSQVGAEIEQGETWTDWAWSFVPTLQYNGSDTSPESLLVPKGPPTLLLSTTIKHITFTFKIPEEPETQQQYNSRPRRLPLQTVCKLDLDNLVMQSCILGSERFSWRCGVSKIRLSSCDSCTCGVPDYWARPDKKSIHIKSLIEDATLSNLVQWPLEVNKENFVTKMSAEDMLSVCPAFAMEYIYMLDIPEEVHSSTVRNFKGNFEYSNFRETSTITFALGPIDVLITSGLIHRLETLYAAIQQYEYTPYIDTIAELKPEDIPPLTVEEKDLLIDYIPLRHISFSANKPCIRVAAWDHPNVASSGKLKKASDHWNEHNKPYIDLFNSLPKLGMEPETLNIDITLPMYPKRVVYGVSQIKDPRKNLWDACHRIFSVQILGLRCFLDYSPEIFRFLQYPETLYEAKFRKETKKDNIPDEYKDAAQKALEENVTIKSDGSVRKAIVTHSNWSINLSKLINPEYFLLISEPLEDHWRFSMEMALCVTLPNAITCHYIAESALNRQLLDNLRQPLFKTSILLDVLEEGTVVLDTTFEAVTLECTKTKNIQNVFFTIGSLKIFALKSEDQEHQTFKQSWVFSAPEPGDIDFLKIGMQRSSNLESPWNYFTIHCQPLSACFDPLFGQWLTYTPLILDKPFEVNMPKASSDGLQTKWVSRAIIEHPLPRSKKASSTSSDKDFVHGSGSHATSSRGHKAKKTTKEIPKDDKVIGSDDGLQKAYRELKTCIVICEIGTISCYFPAISIEATNALSIAQTMEDYIRSTENSTDETITDVLVLCMQNGLILSNSVTPQMKAQFMNHGPTKIMEITKNSVGESLPWKFSAREVSCSTIGTERTFTSRRNTRRQSKVVYTQILHPFTTTVAISILPRKEGEDNKAEHAKLWKKFLKLGLQNDSSESDETADAQSEVKHSRSPKSKKFPKNVKEFLRGPANRSELDKLYTDDESEAEEVISADPVVSPETSIPLVFCIHIETKPVILAFNARQAFTLCSVVHTTLDVMSLVQNTYLELLKSTQAEPAPDSFNDQGTNVCSIRMQLDRDSLLDGALPSETPVPMEGQSFSRFSTEESLDEDPTSSKPEDKKENNPVTFWVQCVMNSFIFKAYAVHKDSSVKKLKLEIEDILSNLDKQKNYTKLKLKVSSFSLKHYTRPVDNDRFSPETPCSLLIRAREVPKTKAQDFGFFSVIMTTAPAASVQTRWQEDTILHSRVKGISGAISDDPNHTLTEIIMALDSVEAIISPTVLEAYMDIAVSFNCAMPHCQDFTRNFISGGKIEETTKSFNLEDWKSDTLPLIYFDSSDLHIMLPVSELAEAETENHDVLLIKIDKIILTPTALNPICRQPHRSNLYQTAARANILNLPGSLLEDRQYQLTVKNVTVRTGFWRDLLEMYMFEEDNALIQFLANPAVLWDQMGKSDIQLWTVFSGLNISLVLAMSMFYKSVLVCGPAVELNLESDIQIDLTTVQIEMICGYLSEADRVIKAIRKSPIRRKWKHRTASWLRDHHVICSSRDFVYHPMTFLAPLISADQLGKSEKKVDSVIDEKGEGTSKSSNPAAKKSLLPIYDIYWTAGGIGLNVYHPVKSRSINASTLDLCDGAKVMHIKQAITKASDQMRKDFYSRRGLQINENEAAPDGYLEPKKPSWLYTHLNEIIVHRLNIKREDGFVPLLYVDIRQPNIYYSRMGEDMKMQLSVYNLFVATCNVVLDAKPTPYDYNSRIFETRKGQCDVFTGVLPSLLTVTIKPAFNSHNYSIDAFVTKPVRLNLSYATALMLKTLGNSVEIISAINQCYDHITYANTDHPVNEYKQSQTAYDLKELLDKIHTCNISMTQFHFEFVMPQDASTKLVLGLTSFVNTTQNVPRPKTSRNTTLVESLFVSASCGKPPRRFLIKPFTFGINLKICWDSWAKGLYSEIRPMVYLMVDSDKIVANLKPEDVSTMLEITKYLKVISNVFLHMDGRKNEPNQRLPKHKHISEKGNEQYYKDDLRIGTFKYIAGDETPRPYQVSIGKKTICWHYPHPRAITRMFTLPVPVKRAYPNQVLRCSVEFFSQASESFEVLTYFHLEQDNYHKLNFLVELPNVVFAYMWRIQIFDPVDVEEKPSGFSREHFLNAQENNPQIVYSIPLKAWMNDGRSKTKNVIEKSSFSSLNTDMLAGSLRVDSLFAPEDVPRFCPTINIHGLDFNILNPLLKENFDNKLTGYQLSPPMAKQHTVVSAQLSSVIIQSQFCKYRLEKFLICGDFNISLSIISMDNLTLMPLTGQVPVRFTVSNKPTDFAQYKLDLRLGVVPIALTSAHIHNIYLLTSQWISEISPVVLTIKKQLAVESTIKYMVSNNTNRILHIGQMDTDECLRVPSLKTAGYCWYNPNAPKLLRIAPKHNAKHQWTMGVKLDLIGLQKVSQNTDGYDRGWEIFIVVQRINSFRYNIKIEGRVVVYNTLAEAILLRIDDDASQVGADKTDCSCIAESNDFVSLISNTKPTVRLQLALPHGDGVWSTYIALNNQSTGTPTEVKVFQNSTTDKYYSIWCHVIEQQGRLLVILCPMYSIVSQVPGSCLVEVTSDSEENVSFFSVSGNGQTQPIMVIGDSTTRHLMSFIFNENIKMLEDGIELHQHLNDVSPPTPFAKTDLEIIRHSLTDSKNPEIEWPYSCVRDDLDNIWYLMNPLMKSDLMIRFCRVPETFTVLVDLAPWGLLVNASGAQLVLGRNCTDNACFVNHGYVGIAPSFMEKEKFHLSLEDEANDKLMSHEIRLTTEATGPYQQMPPGVLAVDKHTNVLLQHNRKIAHITMYFEYIHNMNVFGFAPRFVVTNYVEADFEFTSIALPYEHNRSHIVEFESYEDTHHCSYSKRHHGVPVMKSTLVKGSKSDEEINPNECYTFLIFSSYLSGVRGYSVPVRIDDPRLRRSISISSNVDSVPLVITTQKYRGQVYVGIHKDPAPQFLIQNNTAIDLCLAEISNDSFLDIDGPMLPATCEMLVPECPPLVFYQNLAKRGSIFYSTPTYCYKYPNIKSKSANATHLTFTHFDRAYETDSQWTVPVNVSVTTVEQFVKLPGTAIDVKVSVAANLHTTVVTIDPITKADVSARDIRERLATRHSSISQDTQIPSNLPSKYNKGKKAKILSSTDDDDDDEEVFMNENLQTQSLTNMNDDENPAVELKAEFNAGTEIISHEERIRWSTANNVISGETSAAHIESPGLIERQTNESDIFTMVACTVAASTESFADPAFFSEESVPLRKKSRSSVTFDDIHSFRESFAVGESYKFPSAPLEGESNLVKLSEDDIEVLKKTKRGIISLLEVKMTIDGIEFSLQTEPGNKFSEKGGPILQISCDHTVFNMMPQPTQTLVKFAMQDLQIDNPQHSSGGFDFPVVLRRLHEATSNDVHKIWAPAWNPRLYLHKQSNVREHSILKMEVGIQRWLVNHVEQRDISDVVITIAPIMLFTEDKYVKFLLDFVMDQDIPAITLEPIKVQAEDTLYLRPGLVQESISMASPLRIQRLLINETEINLSVHTSMRMYIALDRSPLHFERFERFNVVTSQYHLGHMLTIHYMSGAIFGAGWVVGSLEILGSPSGLVRRVGTGVRDLILEPYRGLAVGPRALLAGMASGSASFARQLTQGAVESVNMVMGSVARNLDILSLDPEHAERAREERRRRPSGITDALSRGLYNLAVSVLGAVGGIAQHPFVETSLGSSGVTAGLTRGIMGVVAKPLSATADLLAITGQGLISQAGWDSPPVPRAISTLQLPSGTFGDESRYLHKLCGVTLEYIGRAVFNEQDITVILATKWLMIVNFNTDVFIHTYEIGSCVLRDVVHNAHNVTVKIEVLINVPPAGVDSDTDSDIDDAEEIKLKTECYKRLQRYTGLPQREYPYPNVPIELTMPYDSYQNFLSMFTFVKYDNWENHFLLV